MLLGRSLMKESLLESRMGIRGGSHGRYTLTETTPVMQSRLCELEGASWVAHSLPFPEDWGSDIRCHLHSHIHCCNCENPRCWSSCSDEDAWGARRFLPSHPRSSCPGPSDPPSCLIAINVPARPLGCTKYGGRGTKRVYMGVEASQAGTEWISNTNYLFTVL